MNTLTLLEDYQAESLTGGWGSTSNYLLVVGIDYTKVTQDYNQKNYSTNKVSTLWAKNSFTAAAIDVTQINSIG